MKGYCSLRKQQRRNLWVCFASISTVKLIRFNKTVEATPAKITQMKCLTVIESPNHIPGCFLIRGICFTLRNKGKYHSPHTPMTNYCLSVQLWTCEYLMMRTKFAFLLNFSLNRLEIVYISPQIPPKSFFTLKECLYLKPLFQVIFSCHSEFQN